MNPSAIPFTSRLTPQLQSPSQSHAHHHPHARSFDTLRRSSMEEQDEWKLRTQSIASPHPITTSPYPPSTSPHPSMSSYSSTPSPHAMSTTTTPSYSSTLSPSSHERIHALLMVLLDLDNLGIEHKFLDSLHIAYRQMFPQIQITNRTLFDIASQAESLGLVSVSGEDPHRQIQLTAKGVQQTRNIRVNSASRRSSATSFGTSSSTTTPSFTTPTPSFTTTTTSTTPFPSSNTSSFLTSSNTNTFVAPTNPSSYASSPFVTTDTFPSTPSYEQHNEFFPANLHETSLESLLQSADAQLDQYDDMMHSQVDKQIINQNMIQPPISVGGFTNPNNTGAASPLTTSSMLGTNGLPLFNPAPGVFFDANSLEDKLFRGEKPRHLKYMFGFRVNPCHDFLNNKCVAESKTRSSPQCYDYHLSKTKRRVARIYQYSNGIFFNYNACRCQAMEKDEKCDRGDACRYAHCKEEIAYHPSRYKTQQCSYPARSDGVCTRFGAHCISEGTPISYLPTTISIPIEQYTDNQSIVRTSWYDNPGTTMLLSQGNQMCYDIILEGGIHLKATGEHPILCDIDNHDQEHMNPTKQQGSDPTFSGTVGYIRVSDLIQNINKYRIKYIPPPPMYNYGTLSIHDKQWYYEFGVQRDDGIWCNSAGETVLSPLCMVSPQEYIRTIGFFMIVGHMCTSGYVHPHESEMSFNVSHKLDAQEVIQILTNICGSTSRTTWDICDPMDGKYIISVKGELVRSIQTLSAFPLGDHMKTCHIIPHIVSHPFQYVDGTQSSCPIDCIRGFLSTMFGGMGIISTLQMDSSMHWGVDKKIQLRMNKSTQYDQNIYDGMMVIYDLLNQVGLKHIGTPQHAIKSNISTYSINIDASQLRTFNESIGWGLCFNKHMVQGIIGITPEKNDSMTWLKQIGAWDMFIKQDGTSPQLDTTFVPSITLPITSIQLYDVLPVYDISIVNEKQDNYQHFISNGMIVHNCAFAHGDDDMRKPLILKQGMPHKLIDGSDGAPVALQARNMTGLESDDGPIDRPLRLDDFICSTAEMPSERQFYMYTYKTKPCSEPTVDCARGTCPNYHYANKRRRNPKLYNYTYEPCPNVKSPDSGQWRQPSACEKGDACPYAHTLLESMYHPDVYKTVLCSNFDEHDPSNWKCQWGRHCAHAHSQAELEYIDQDSDMNILTGGKRGSLGRTSFSGFLPASAATTPPIASPAHSTPQARVASPALPQSLTVSMPGTPVNQPRPSPLTQARALAMSSTSSSPSPSPFPSDVDMRRNSLPRGYASSNPSSPHTRPKHGLSVVRGREEEEDETSVLKKKITTMQEELDQHQRHQNLSQQEINNLTQRLHEMDQLISGDMNISDLVNSLRSQLKSVQEQQQGVQWECMQLRDSKQKQDITHAEIMRTLAKQQEEKNAMEVHYKGLQEEMNRLKQELNVVSGQRDEAVQKLSTPSSRDETPSNHSRNSSLMSQHMWDRSIITCTPEEWDHIQTKLTKLSYLITYQDMMNILKQINVSSSIPTYDTILSNYVMESIMTIDVNNLTVHARIKGGNDEVVIHITFPAQPDGLSLPIFHTSYPPHPHILPIFSHFTDQLSDDQITGLSLSTPSPILHNFINTKGDIIITAPYVTCLTNIHKKWNIRELIYLALQLCSGILHLHKYGIIHGNINMNHVMVMSRTILEPTTTTTTTYPTINMTSSNLSSPSLSSRTISLPNSIATTPLESPIMSSRLISRRPSIHPLITPDRIIDIVIQDATIMLSPISALCVDISVSSKQHVITTPITPYIAPEWITAMSHNIDMDWSGVDAWSFGMLLYQLLTGTTYHAYNQDQMYMPPEITNAPMESTLHHVIASLLHTDPKQRMSVKQAQSLLEQEYWNSQHYHIQQRMGDTKNGLLLDLTMKCMDVDKDKHVHVGNTNLHIEDELLLDGIVNERLKWE